jgi:CMP-N-acetylneuraminic acid synthetase
MPFFLLHTAQGFPNTRITILAASSILKSDSLTEEIKKHAKAPTEQVICATNTENVPFGQPSLTTAPRPSTCA